MAQLILDPTGNSSGGVEKGNLNTMLAELYAATGATALTPATIVASGLITGGSAKLDTGTKTGTASSGAVTLSKSSGKVTSEALTTAAGAVYTLTITNTTIAAADQVFASATIGAGTQGYPVIADIKPAAGSVVIKVLNAHATDAFNAAIVVAFMVLKA